MSFDYDLKKIKDREDVCFVESGGSKVLHPTLHAFIFATMIVGLCGINEKNINQWKERVKMLTLIDLCPFRVGSGHYIPSNEDYERFKGLHTNVIHETDAEWNKRFILMAKDQAELIK